jgi:hypothetical protein
MKVASGGRPPPGRARRSVPVPPDPTSASRRPGRPSSALKDGAFDAGRPPGRAGQEQRRGGPGRGVDAAGRAGPWSCCEPSSSWPGRTRRPAKATLQAAEASLSRALANVRDVEPLPDATVKEKLERAAEDGSEPPTASRTARARTALRRGRRTQGRHPAWPRRPRPVAAPTSSGSASAGWPWNGADQRVPGPWRRPSPRPAAPPPTSPPPRLSPSAPPRPGVPSSRPAPPTARPTST